MDDFLLTPEGLYVPLDFKTRGFPRKDNTHESYQLQMDCYTLLLEKNSLPTAGRAILLFYHPLRVNAQHNIEFHPDPCEIPTSPARAEEVFQEAIACLQGEEPPPDKECGFCRWEG